MAIYDSSRIKSQRLMWSQTPPGLTEDNYYLNSIQMKVDADWPFRANRYTVEEEFVTGSEIYTPIEVLIDSVKNDKGTPVSDDWYRLTFRDCSRVNRIGYKYRFAYRCDSTDEFKNVWLGMNQTTMSATSSQVICRCNTTIGSIYTDADGVTSYHYEPVIQPSTLNSTGFDYSEVAIDPNGSMMIIAQYNRYTKQYYMNQRFVIGTDAVYKITNIIKSDSRSTYNPEDVGLMRIYLAIDQIGKLDDMEKRIAYNGKETTPIPEGKTDNYILSIIDPEAISEIIPDDGLTLTLQLKNNDEVISGTISASASLVGTGTGTVSDYITLTNNGDNTFTIQRKKISTVWKVQVVFSATINNTQVSVDVILSLRPF